MQTVIAAFDDHQAAERAVERLLQHGFGRESVHLQAGYGGDLSSATSASDTTSGSDTGPLSGVGDFFGSVFKDDPRSADAGNYAEAVRRGSTIVVVDAKTDAEVDQARALMYELGSVDVDQRAAKWKSEGWSGFDANARPLSSDELSAERQNVMQVVQEELVVGKRTVETGGVRVVKRITETPVSELVTLRQERAVIERRPVDRPASDADLASFKELTIEVQETSEEAVVSKTSRVVEEVVVGKQVTERSETVEDTVRRTDVDVERVEATPTATGSGTTAGMTGMASTPAAAYDSLGTSGGRSTIDGERDSANRDPLTGEPGAHPVGTGVGAALGGAAAGAVTGTVAGPVGTVIGAAVGAIAGGLAGKGVAEKVDPTTTGKP